MDRVRLAEKSQLRTDLPRPSVGDSIEVSVKIKEGDKERTQVFSGTVIGIRGGGLGETFTVRRLVAGEGVERIFPLHSPLLSSLTVVSKGRVRRAKLHYLRARKGKSTRLTAILGGEGHGAAAEDAGAQGAESAPAAGETAKAAKAGKPGAESAGKATKASS